MRRIIVSLNELSDEQDFMLGVMLGYGRLVQCDRYLQRRSRRRRSFEGREPAAAGAGGAGRHART
jgi:hypothetical protein